MQIDNKYQIGQIVYGTVRSNSSDTMSVMPYVITGIIIQDNDGSYDYDVAYLGSQHGMASEWELFTTREDAQMYIEFLRSFKGQALHDDMLTNFEEWKNNG